MSGRKILKEKFTKCICALMSQMNFFLLILPGEIRVDVSFVLIFVNVKLA